MRLARGRQWTGTVTIGYAAGSPPVRFPWRAVVLIAAAWGATVPFMARYVVPAAPLGRMADGPSPGYEVCYAYGPAFGCFERQVRHRQSAAEAGWQCRVVTREDVAELFAGRVWPVSTVFLPWVVLAMVVPVGWYAVRLVGAASPPIG